MGSTESKSETKTIDTTGNVNNNVVINDQVNIYSREITGLLAIICVLKIIEFIYFIYTKHYRRIKKHLTQQSPPQP